MNPSLLHVLRLWERRILVLLIYALPLHEASKNVFWGLLVALGLARCFMERQWPGTGRVGWGALAWLAAGIWSSCFAIEPSASWKGLWDMARGAVLLWVMGSIASAKPGQPGGEDCRVLFLKHLILSACLASVVAFWDYGWAIYNRPPLAPVIHLQLRSVGHFNQSAIYLAMAWILTLAAVLDQQVFARRRICMAAFAMIGLALLGTTSRSAIAVAGLVGFLIMLNSRPPRWLIGFCLVAALFVMAGLVSSASLRSRVLFQGSFRNRVTLWQSACAAVQTRWWTGVGLNNFKNISLKKEDPLSFGTVDHAHSLYFNTLAQLGLPGSVALLALLAASGGTIWKCRPAAGGRRLWFYGAGGGWLIVVLVGFSNATIHHEISMLFFILLGMMIQVEKSMSCSARVRVSC